MAIMKSMASVLSEAAAMKSKKKMVEHLSQHDNLQMRMMILMALDPEIQWDLPETPPPYTPNKIPYDGESILYTEMRKMYLFLKGPNKLFGDEFNPNIKPSKREMLFIQLLENLQPNDAEMVACALQKKLPHPELTLPIIKEAFPGILANVT